MRPDRAPIGRRPDGADAPLSFAQQRLWLLDQLEPSPWAYNVVVTRRIRGALLVGPLQSALDQLLARHEGLRTTFPSVGGRVVQRIGPAGPLALRMVDLSGRDIGSAESEARKVAEVEARRRFDLVSGPMVRAVLTRLAAEDHVLVLTMHHIVTDAWSETVLLRELDVLYGAIVRDEASPLPPLPIQYADYAVWQRDRAVDDGFREQLDYWLARLDGMAPLLEIPTARPRPAKRSGRGGVVDITLPAKLTDAVRQTARAGRATVFMTLLAAFQALLARYSGSDDIPVGTAIANRPRKETEGLVGFFANTLVLRTDLSGDPSFLDVIERVREVSIGAYRQQELPFERLVKALRPERSLGHTALFQHMFVFQNTGSRDLELDGLATEPFVLNQDTAMFDLTLTLNEEPDSVWGTLEYATDLYDRETAERIARDLLTLLEAAMAAPDRPIRELNLLDPADRQRVLTEWNDTATPFPRRCIHELFEEQAAEHPDATALISGDVSLTYAELDERADALADRLRSLGVSREDRVGVCLHRSIDAVVAILATLKAGGAYVPLDPEHPAKRLAFMVNDSNAQVIVTRFELCDRVDHCGSTLLCIDDARLEPAAPPITPDSLPSSERLAYVMYTSGSTGEPKGVLVEHGAVVALLIGVDYVHFDDVAAILHLAPLAFDASTFEIWGSLLQGATCVVYPEQRFALDRLRSVLAQGVDTVWLTSAVFNTVIDEDPGMLRDVKQLVVGGEALSVRHVARALELFPGVRLVNGYGPTETTTFAVCHEIRSLEPAADRVPIGRPIANTELYILDPAGHPVPIGLPGELHIGGAGLARGYLNRPELTAERFVAHPFSPDASARIYRTGDLARYRADGVVEYLGRLDDQVKVRGFRVEPGEIEAALRDAPGVATAAVIAPVDDRGRRRLVGFVTADGTLVPSPSGLRDHLRERLPEHLVPGQIAVVDHLPLNVNGKIDRQALAGLQIHADPVARSAVPTTPTECLLALIWSEVLGIERVGVDDDFFAIGGDSLMAAVVFAKLVDRTGRMIPLSSLISGPTIRQLARSIDDGDTNDSTVVPLRGDGSKPALFLAHGISGELFRYVDLVRRLGPDQPVYGLRPSQSVVTADRRLQIPELARRYVDDILAVQPDGPFRLAGFCFGGLVMVEMAHQLEQRGHAVSLLALFDAELPSSLPAGRIAREIAQVAAVFRHEESVAPYLRRRSENVRTKARRWPWLAEDWVHIRTGRPLSARWNDAERVHALRVSPLWRALSRALASFVAPETDCTITYFCAGDPTVESSLVHQLPGSAGRGETLVVDGPGIDHDSLLKEPHVNAIVAVLTDRID